MARNKYSYYASKAKKDGYVQVAKLFKEIAHNEQEHAKIWFKLLHGGTVASTIENLKGAAEGFYGLAKKFRAIAKIEKALNGDLPAPGILALIAAILSIFVKEWIFRVLKRL